MERGTPGRDGRMTARRFPLLARVRTTAPLPPLPPRIERTVVRGGELVRQVLRLTPHGDRWFDEIAPEPDTAA
jgi:hypothetical protein